MRTGKLWRPGTEMPDRTFVTALIAKAIARPGEGGNAVRFPGLASWQCDLPGYLPAWQLCSPGFHGRHLSPGAGFWWLPLEKLQDILIAEYDIEAL